MAPRAPRICVGCGSGSCRLWAQLAVQATLTDPSGRTQQAMAAKQCPQLSSDLLEVGVSDGDTPCSLRVGASCSASVLTVTVFTKRRKERGRTCGSLPQISFPDRQGCHCTRPVAPVHVPHLLSLSQEAALRLFTKAPCWWGFEAEVPISRLITKLIRQLGDSCCGGLWGTGTAPNHVTCSKTHLLASSRPWREAGQL